MGNIVDNLGFFAQTLHSLQYDGKWALLDFLYVGNKPLTFAFPGIMLGKLVKLNKTLFPNFINMAPKYA